MENKDVMEYVMRLSRVSRRRRGQDGEVHQVPRGMFRVMRLLSAQEALRSGDIAKQLDIRAGSLSEALAKMERAGLVSRQKDPKDSRIALISLTENGLDQLAKANQRYEERRQKLETVLTTEERAQFIQICDKLIAFFEAENQLVEGEKMGMGHPRHDGPNGCHRHGDKGGGDGI